MVVGEQLGGISSAVVFSKQVGNVAVAVGGAPFPMQESSVQPGGPPQQPLFGGTHLLSGPNRFGITLYRRAVFGDQK
jgi:hypothetical protein